MARDESPAETPEDEQEAEARARREAGIEHLSDGEELIDTELFSRMHARLALGGAPDDEADLPEGFEDTTEAELLLEEVATELPPARQERRSAVRAGAPPRDTGELAALEREMLVAKSRDEVAVLALRIARHYARAAALFVVNRDLIAGLRGAGDGVEERLEGIMIPAKARSAIAECVSTGRLTRTRAPFGHVDQRLLRAMGRPDVAEVAVLPVRIRRRVVNLLYADNGAEPLAETSIGALHVLCTGIARAYERVILERKKAALAERG